MTEVIGTLRVIPEIVRLNPVIEEKFSLDVSEGKKNTCTKMFAGRLAVGKIFS